MKAFEIRQLPEEEIKKRIQEELINLSNLKFQKSIGQLESPIKLRTVRRTIARLKTILREKELARLSVLQQKGTK